jgi:hypothetical protein
MQAAWIRAGGFALVPQLLISLSVRGQATTAPAGKPGTTLDAGALLADVRALAADSMEGRRTGTAGAERARRYIEQRLAAIGVQPLGDGGFRRAFPLRAGPDSARREGVNLVGRIPGRGPGGRVMVITAHYDHVGVRNGQIFNGADDNASGVAALLAVARALAGEPPRHTVVFAVLDSEEGGLQGARAFVAAPPVPLGDVAININFDMVSRNEAGELWAVGTRHYPFLRPFVESLAAGARVRLRIGHDGADPGAQDWTGQSDHAAFYAAGIPFLYFGVEDHADYHRPSDDFERIEPGFFAAAAATLVDAVRRLDRELDGIVPRGGDDVSAPATLAPGRSPGGLRRPSRSVTFGTRRGAPAARLHETTGSP